MFNNHRLSKENNWTPNQIWLNGLLHEDHPVNNNNKYDSGVDKFYVEDPDGPRPQEDDDYGVSVLYLFEIAVFLCSQGP